MTTSTVALPVNSAFARSSVEPSAVSDFSAPRIAQETPILGDLALGDFATQLRLAQKQAKAEGKILFLDEIAFTELRGR